jgi:death-on-curing protein
MIDAEKVIEIHDLILSEEPGLPGDLGRGSLEGALARVESRIQYEGMNSVFEIAAMYAVSLARGHVFNDANKRTALVTALTYLELQGVSVPKTDELEEIMVAVAQGELEHKELANQLFMMASWHFE